MRLDCRAGNSTELAGIWGITPKVVRGHCQPIDNILISVTLIAIVNKNVFGNCRSPTIKKQNKKQIPKTKAERCFSVQKKRL